VPPARRLLPGRLSPARALPLKILKDIFRNMSINDEGPGPAAALGPPPLRRIADAPTLRALAHPTRLAILEALGRGVPLTATEAAEIVGESPSACSFHLRMLAKYGLVEDAGGATGRRRPWRRTDPAGFTFPDTDDDPAAALAAGALSDLMWGRLLDRARAVLARRPQLPAQWREITSAAETVAYVTPAEADQFNAEMWALIGRYTDRLADPSLRPPGSLPVEILLFSYPLDAATGMGVT
jgi:DNA-binding transcriptional ArsR family regulator